MLGPGCAKCYAVERAAASGLEVLLNERLDLEALLEHIEDILEIEQYPVLFTPALVVNEKVACAGWIPKKEEVVAWYLAALERAA